MRVVGPKEHTFHLPCHKPTSPSEQSKVGVMIFYWTVLPYKLFESENDTISLSHSLPHSLSLTLSLTPSLSQTLSLDFCQSRECLFHSWATGIRCAFNTYQTEPASLHTHTLAVFMGSSSKRYNVLCVCSAGVINFKWGGY